MKKLKITKNTIRAGISIDNEGNFVFDWKVDDSYNDIVKLVEHTGGTFNKDDIMYIYAYMFYPNADNKHINKFRSALKDELEDSSIFYSEDISDFVGAGVLHIEEYISFKEIGATINIASTKLNTSLLDLISSHISDNLPGYHVSLELVKRMYEGVQFDSEKSLSALLDTGRYSEGRARKQVEFTVRKFEELKKTKTMFEIKRFIPKELRVGFSNFLYFEREEHRTLYEALQDTVVLVYDDIYTSGSTVNEIISYIKSIHNNNKLVVFVLLSDTLQSA